MIYTSHHDIFSYIILLGVIQGIFISMFLLKQRKDGRPALLFLGILLFFMTLMNFDFWAGYTFTTIRLPHLLDISVPLTFAMGPLIYHYTLHYLSCRKNRHLVLHYLPAVLIFLYSFFFYLQSADFKYNVIVLSRKLDFPLIEPTLHFSPDPLHIRRFFGSMASFQLVVYLVLSIRLYYFSAFRKEETSAGISLPGKIWLRNALIASFLIITIAVIIQLLFPGGAEEYILATCFSLFIYFTSLQLFRQSDFIRQGLIHVKYSKSSLNAEMKTEFIKRIDQVMNNEKPYLNNLFSLKIFAKAVGASPNHLSQLLNEHYGMSFYEFVADHRIKEAKIILKDPGTSGMKIEQMAFLTGYNSKAAFNKAFKIRTGQTPQMFRKNPA